MATALDLAVLLQWRVDEVSTGVAEEQRNADPCVEPEKGKGEREKVGKGRVGKGRKGRGSSGIMRPEAD
jgi:hypothetical protein